MAVTFSKDNLSGSTGGRGITVAATSSPGTTIHTASTTLTTIHELWLYAVNTGSAATYLTIQFGNTATSDATTVYIEPNTGLQLIIPGLILEGAASAHVVRAYATTTNIVNIFGYVNVIA